MSAALVNPLAGYITLSRFDSERRRPSTSVWTRSGLIGDLRWILVGAQATPGGVAQVPVRGPVAVPDLADHDRPHEVGQPRHRRGKPGAERARIPGQRREPVQRSAAVLPAEPGPPFPSEPHPAAPRYPEQGRA